MPTRDYSRTIALRCPTCGGTQFEHDDDIDAAHAVVRCVGCGRVMPKDELIWENSENIEAHAGEIGKEVVEDFARDMKARLKKAFHGSKHIKFK